MYGLSRTPVLTDLFCHINYLCHTENIHGDNTKNIYKVFPKVKIPSVSYPLLAVGSISHRKPCYTVCNYFEGPKSAQQRKVATHSLSYCTTVRRHKVEVLTCCCSSLLFLSVSHSITSTAGALMLVSCLTANQRITSIELRYCVASVETDYHMWKGLEPQSLFL